MSTPVLKGNESGISGLQVPSETVRKAEVFPPTFKSAVKDLSSELISFTGTQQRRANAHSFKTVTNITGDQTNNETFGCDTSD